MKLFKKLTKKQRRAIAHVEDGYDKEKRGIYEAFYSSPSKLLPRANEDLAYALWQLDEQRNCSMRNIIYGDST